VVHVNPCLVPADRLINITLTWNTSPTYALLRKLGPCKSGNRCNLIVRKTYPNFEVIYL
jgi:hypothetical protein